MHIVFFIPGSSTCKYNPFCQKLPKQSLKIVIVQASVNKQWCDCILYERNMKIEFFILFFKRLTFVGSAWSFFFSSPPQRPMSSDFEGFSIPDFIHYIYFPILILDDEPVFPFLMFSAKQGNYWYHFYNVFGMTDPCLGIEPGTSRTRSQHSTTGLSRRL